jgi:hypothetical protein
VRRLRIASSLPIAALAALGLVLDAGPPARANGDPASDILLARDVFVPYDAPPSTGVARALLELTRRTRADGWPVEVAIVTSRKDLGTWAAVFNRPAQYADILAQELRGPRLLVVMPAGFGTQHTSDEANRALAGLRPIQDDGDRMGRLTLTAVARMAAADGHPVDVPPVDTGPEGRRPYRQPLPRHDGPVRPAPAPGATTPSAAPGGSGPSPFVYAVPVVLIVALLGGMALRERLRGDRGQEDARP